MDSDIRKYELLLSRMQRLCSVREYCTYDIVQKLRKEDLPEEQIIKIIESLTRDKFISDLRYASAFAGDKSKFGGWGPGKIIFALKSKKIAPEILHIIKENIDEESSRVQLKKILEQKLRGIKIDEPRDKVMAKLLRFGLSRGFDYGEVYEISKQITSFKNNS